MARRIELSLAQTPLRTLVIAELDEPAGYGCFVSDSAHSFALSERRNHAASPSGAKREDLQAMWPSGRSKIAACRLGR